MKILATLSVLSLITAAAPRAPAGRRTVHLDTSWAPLATGPAVISRPSFVPGRRMSSDTVVVYGFALASDKKCRMIVRDPVPQPGTDGKWGPYRLAKDRTLCATASGGEGELTYLLE